MSPSYQQKFRASLMQDYQSYFDATNKNHTPRLQKYNQISLSPSPSYEKQKNTPTIKIRGDSPSKSKSRDNFIQNRSQNSFKSCQSYGS
jgi:hypothetical protein